MYLEHLSLTDFRSYAQVDLALEPGVTVLVGYNGIGKTNLMEAIGYLATLSSHRVSSDAPLLRFGTERALVRARLVRGTQTTVLELEINGSRANRGRINRSNPVRARDLVGICQTVLFAPEDLALVKGDPSNRRRFLDELLASLIPHHAATRSDYDRVLKQRNALLKSARAGRFTSAHESTLEVWDQHMARAGAELLHARLELVERLRPHLARAYAELTDASKPADATYRSTLQNQMDDDGVPAGSSPRAKPGGSSDGPDDLRLLSVDQLTERYIQAFAESRKKELERGISLVGPHRDDLELMLGQAPAKGYASHGETWSMCLSLRLASYYVMLDDARTGGSAPILILDDVFAELDVQRRRKLAAIVSGAEQVLVTAAVDADIPGELSGRRVKVVPGGIDEQ
ncbi:MULTISPECIES: DNA replication/repair protein RecF [Pseudarthrobacter]|uniref:DNA replication and repair protein RecF n=1 Tax=Pseudarthrobacter niigatensis TaxID=369935 RepID=A0AAJ1SWZ2_9MICC|nr:MULTISPECIES: DNA replication/repair protein RecF [Pseudarthrobacter]MDQ0147714.1 DNA replication and repair protein RecF [Pseudarthrobacter niigatensis]MDQ0267655.1 DNA replication and repair protein RecF [Pseudarthrobacter niigatensis]QDG90172.1 DNA replication/repair protein RecF [Pseudarthrobacter sp. NIBRBAC000502770]